MTTNGNLLYNFLEYFVKKHLGFTEPLSDLYGILEFRGTQFEKHCTRLDT